MFSSVRSAHFVCGLLGGALACHGSLVWIRAAFASMPNAQFVFCGLLGGAFRLLGKLISGETCVAVYARSFATTMIAGPGQYMKGSVRSIEPSD